MNPYELALALTGVALLGAVWLPRLLKRHPLTFPIVFVALGAGLYFSPLPLPEANPLEHGTIVEHLTELAVIVALAGAGLRIDTAFGWKRWSLTWRLLGLTMPLCIVAGAWLGHELLGHGFAASVLLSAVLAPTDPVLASDVQVYGPGEGGEDPVRFALTSEAGLNDGLAFPFVWLAIVLASPGVTGADWTAWLAVDVLWRVAGGIAVGGLLGYGLMHLIFRSASDRSLSRGSDGLTVLAITLFVYGSAELCQAYGFLAVFVAALVIRQYERTNEYHSTLSLFAEQCERLLTALVLVLFGGALASGLLAELGWRDLMFASLFVLVVRPVAGLLGLLGTGLALRERFIISAFGVRGIGSLYYLAFALNQTSFTSEKALWAQVSLVVVLSILLHGLSAKQVMSRLDRSRGRPTQPPPARDS